MGGWSVSKVWADRWADMWAVCEVWADRWVEGEGKTKGFMKTKSSKGGV